jgi:hypothetical protein
VVISSSFRHDSAGGTLYVAQSIARTVSIVTMRFASLCRARVVVQVEDRVLFEPAAARYLKKVEKQEKKWRGNEAKRSASAIALKKTFGLAMYDVKKFPSPLLLTLQMHMLAKKEKGVDQTLRHLNRFFWFTTAGRGLKSSALLELITSEEHRLRW